MSEFRANAEAAYAIALASDPAIKALTTVAPPDVVRMAWILGYVKGTCAGLEAAHALICEQRAA